MIAEALVYKRAMFNDVKLNVLHSKGIASFQKQILDKVYISKQSNFHISDYHKLIEELVIQCFEQKLIRINFFQTKIVNTKKFHKQVGFAMAAKELNQAIVDYIDSREIQNLDKIDYRISKIELPKYHKPIEPQTRKYPFNEDGLDVAEEAVGNLYGFFRHW